MKREKKLFFLILILSILFIKTDVLAAECTNTDRQILKEEAMNVDVTYQLNIPSEDKEFEPGTYFYDVKVNNAGNNLTLRIGNFYYDYRDAQNGEIVVKEAFLSGGYNASIKIYANENTNCQEELLRTVTLKIPYYNFYSSREECQDYQDKDICKPTSNTENITEKDFLAAIENIKKEASSTKKEKTREVKKNIFDKYWENKAITIPITIIIVLLIIVIIINILTRKKNKIKVDLGDK